MTVILHHYDTSPFSELLRIAFGIKAAAWGSVTIPNIAPKPLLTPLTGGYRKTPVLQVGADIYCDTAAAIEVIEALPGPTLFPQPLGRSSALIAGIASGPWFFHAVGAAMGPVAAMIPDAFWADREALFGLNRSALETRAPHARAQFLAAMVRVEDALADGRAFFAGGAPGYADCAVYMLLWFQRRFDPAAPILAAYPQAVAWEARVKAIGHGTPTAMTGEEALAVAKAATPHIAELVDPVSGFILGQAVTVATEDPGADKVAGMLLRLTDHDIAILRDDPAVGTVAVHFPRAGQIVRPD